MAIKKASPSVVNAPRKLTAEAIAGFVRAFLMPSLDEPFPVPRVHYEWWEDVCSDHSHVAIAAPRRHAKSTAITFAYVLASLLFRSSQFAIIISSTERMAIMFLDTIRKQLVNNADLQTTFQIARIAKDTESLLIVQFSDGKQFCIAVRGAEQKTRGINWGTIRPDLIVADDMEDDEQVMNEERRLKLRKWFSETVLQLGSGKCKYRIVGTILHLDSLLERIMPDVADKDTVWEELKMYSKSSKSGWKATKYRAHPGMDDFSSLLWPEKWTEEELRKIQGFFRADSNLEGYSQEYLNYPLVEENAYFRKDDFLYIKDDREKLDYYAAADLAISEKDGRAYTAIVVAGLNSEGILKIVDVRRFRGDSLAIIEEIFSVQIRYKPELFCIEQENIARSIGAFLNQAQRDRQIFINIYPVVVTQDKIKRARSMQARMRSGSVQFALDADWFPAFQAELLSFPRGRYADQVDAFAHIGLMLDAMVDSPSTVEREDDERDTELYGNFLSEDSLFGDTYSGY